MNTNALPKTMQAALVALAFPLFGQEDFKFQMNFEDAQGNRDSIVYGYDSAATIGIDSGFGEVDIVNVPWNGVFDVRLADVSGESSTVNPPTIQSKKQIVKNQCTESVSLWEKYVPFVVEIYAKHWPVKVKWDKDLFGDECRKGSVFAGVHPGGWWDVGPTGRDLVRAILNEKDSVILNSSHVTRFLTSEAYVSENNDTIPVFWLAVGDIRIIDRFAGIARNRGGKNAAYFPQITGRYLPLPQNGISVEKIRFYDLHGRVVHYTQAGGVLDLVEMKPGIHIVEAVFANGGRIAAKIFRK